MDWKFRRLRQKTGDFGSGRMIAGDLRTKHEIPLDMPGGARHSLPARRVSAFPLEELPPIRSLEE